MHLNPFSHNYLNQLPTSKGLKANVEKIHNQYVKIDKKPSNKMMNQEQIRYKPSNILEAQFLLQPRYIKCNIQYTKEGFLFVFLRKDNIISGRSYILFPEGIVANCNVINSKLSGWIAICKKDQFYNISHFSGGKLDGLQFVYDLRCSLTIESLYHCGKLQSVKRGVADSQVSFQKCLKNKQLIQLLRSTLNHQFLQHYLPKIQSSLGNYYGSKTRQMPNGLGVLITESQWFYGNFKKGLLSEEGVMIFNNGNSYIGQFNEGMMRGYGNFIKNGVYQFKLNQTFISQNQYNAQRNIASFIQNKEIANIFHPIISLYEKLKVIYQSRRKDPDQKSESFVDVQMDNNINDQEESDNKQSQEQTPRGNTIEQLTKSNNNYTNNSKQSDSKNKKGSFALSLTPIHQFSKEQKKQDNRQKSKQYDQPSNKKKYNKILLRDQEWQQIIQELGEENVSNQDGFLKPKREKYKQQSSQITKKSGINSRIGGQNYMDTTDSQADAMDKLQNQLIGKIITKK